MIVQILAMIAEQERTESKRRQAQGIALAKKMAYIKADLNSIQKMLKILKKNIYRLIVENLSAGVPISEIVKERGATRKTIYRIKKELERLLQKN